MATLPTGANGSASGNYDIAEITFNQLYGGGQGVYGCAEHTGVTTYGKLTKTIYIKNDLVWTNLKLDYWFANGSDRWTTPIEGIGIADIGEGVYRVDLPIYADGFKITGTINATVESLELPLSGVEENKTYTLNGVYVEYAERLDWEISGGDEGDFDPDEWIN